MCWAFRLGVGIFRNLLANLAFSRSFGILDELYKYFAVMLGKLCNDFSCLDKSVVQVVPFI